MTEPTRTVAGSDDPATAHAEGDANSAVAYYRAATSETDRFSRRRPALLEGPEQAWKASRDLIDFGVRLLELSGRVQTSSDEEKVREFVYLALLRRALVTTEAAWMLLAKGLYELALAQIRTLLDVQLNINLIHGDASPKMAIRLGGITIFGISVTAKRRCETVTRASGRLPMVLSKGPSKWPVRMPGTLSRLSSTRCGTTSEPRVTGTGTPRWKRPFDRRATRPITS